MLASYPKQYLAYEKIMLASAKCQACLSPNSLPNDFIITCELCRSAIHQNHYGSQLLVNAPDHWMCERCRQMIALGPQAQIKCRFCPSIRGIMKQLMFNKQKIWVHLQCASMFFPLIYFTCKKRQGLKQIQKNQSSSFWLGNQQNPTCYVCHDTYGMHLKCKYYSCKKYFHITCAEKEGVIRDLQSMKIEHVNTYIPVYCEEHLEKRVEDFEKRAKRARQRGDEQQYHTKMKQAAIYRNQLNNLLDAIKQYQHQQQLRKQLTTQNEVMQQQNPSLSFQDIEQQNQSIHSQQFYNFVQKQILAYKQERNQNFDI